MAGIREGSIVPSVYFDGRASCSVQGTSRATLRGCEDDECSLCTESRRYLKLLPCGHSFCEYCVQQLVVHCTHDVDSFPCPNCRAKTPVPARGASDFPFHVQGAKTTLRVSQLLGTLKTGPERGTVAEKCEDCDEEACKYKCFHCQKVVCEFCRDNHTQADHPLLLLPNFGLDLTGAGDASQCEKHGFQDLTHYCQKCQELLCQVCVQTRDAMDIHKDHHISTLDQAASSAEEKLKETRNNVDRCLRRLQADSDDLVKQQGSLDKAIHEAGVTLRQRAAEFRALVDQHERDALAMLRDVAYKGGKNLQAKISSVERKTAALSAVRMELNRVLSANTKAEVVRTDVRASETIEKGDYFHKFTDDLPTTLLTVKLKYDPFNSLVQHIKGSVGQPVVVQTPRDPPAVRVVEKHRVQLEAQGTFVAGFVCPVGESEVWLSRSEESGKTTVVLYDTVTEVIKRQETSEDPVVLTKVDDHLVVAQYKAHNDLLCLEGHFVSYELTRGKFFITNKGSIRAILFYLSKGRTRKTYVVLDITSGFEANATGFVDKAVVVPDLQIPISMDISQDTKWLAVVDEKHVIRLYNIRKDLSVNLLRTVDPGSDVLNHRVTDVCFYRLGRGQVLLLADPTKEDVMMVDFRHNFKFIGFLTNQSGDLRHPFAMDVRPANGLLYVACEERSVVVCGDTGVDVGS